MVPFGVKKMMSRLAKPEDSPSAKAEAPFNMLMKGAATAVAAALAKNFRRDQFDMAPVYMKSTI